MKNKGIAIALAALAVSAPRIILALLAGDGITAPPHVEATIMTLTGLATGIVLTGGTMILAHHVAAGHSTGWLRAFHVTAWLLSMTFATVIMAPYSAQALAHSSLAETLDTPGKVWTWAVVSILAVELIAAAAVTTGVQLEQPNVRTQTRPNAWTRLSAAVVDRAVRQLEQPVEPAPAARTPRPAQVVQPSPSSNMDTLRQQATAARRRTKQQALDDLLLYLAEHPDASLEQAGQAIGRAKSTVSAYVSELEQAERLYKNGQGWEIRT